MQALLIVLRAIHIFSGVFWAGFVLIGATVTFPRIREMGPEGRGLFRAMAESRRSTLAFTVSAGLAVVSGVLLFWLVYGFAFPWSITQWAFAIGGVSAIASPGLGAVIGPLITPAPAKAEAGAGETAINEQRVRGMALLLSITIVLMATARYLY
jgi:hypothetical protein